MALWTPRNRGFFCEWGWKSGWKPLISHLRCVGASLVVSFASYMAFSTKSSSNFSSIYVPRHLSCEIDLIKGVVQSGACECQQCQLSTKKIFGHLVLTCDKILICSCCVFVICDCHMWHMCFCMPCFLGVDYCLDLCETCSRISCGSLVRKLMTMCPNVRNHNFSTP